MGADNDGKTCELTLSCRPNKGSKKGDPCSSRKRPKWHERINRAQYLPLAVPKSDEAELAGCHLLTDYQIISMPIRKRADEKEDYVSEVFM